MRARATEEVKAPVAAVTAMTSAIPFKQDEETGEQEEEEKEEEEEEEEERARRARKETGQEERRIAANEPRPPALERRLRKGRRRGKRLRVRPSDVPRPLVATKLGEKKKRKPVRFLHGLGSSFLLFG